ncbi:hypothetical protein RHSIM_Rhsim04G0121600 [Rhododendron simsii]|uniref:DUF7356 domain-containing protein n=1 Tax=Rhododendron simsii TaxID=118357 RepID=A0A834H1J3_RHOSS|nr:hypothetical protein RHSIM_Rhsim04G0121600 [Rhododendron simsii]
MDRNGLLCVIFLFLIGSDCSSAYSPWNLRKLTGAAPTVSPLLSPVSSGGDKDLKANPVDGGKSKQKDPESSNGLTKANPKGSKSDDSENPSTKEVGGESHEEKNEGKFVHLAGEETCDRSTNRCSSLETLTGCIQRLETGNFIALLGLKPQGLECHLAEFHGRNANSGRKSWENNEHFSPMAYDFNPRILIFSVDPPRPISNAFDRHQKGFQEVDTLMNILPRNFTDPYILSDILALLLGGYDIYKEINIRRYSRSLMHLRSKDLVLLIQNEGEGDMNVHITISTSLRKVNYQIPKHQTKGINVPQTIGGNTRTKIILKSGNGECTIQMGPHQSKGDFFQQLPSYYKQLTPIYGAYLLFLIALIVGGTWACCKIRKRRRHDGVPYQELEMGVPESASAVNLEAAEGWDDGWDDDWDEDKAVRSPGGRHVGSISSSGLTARSANKDGWGNDWDD